MIFTNLASNLYMSNLLKRIVLADDDDDDINLFKEAANELCPGIELMVVDDGRKLMSLLKEVPKPDAIVLDLNMPAKSGKECLVELRNNPEFDSVKIFILSTSGNKSDINYCLDNGANYYFTKPPLYAETLKIVGDICNPSFATFSNRA